MQGIHDMVLFSFVAFASLMSGFVFNAYSWEALNLIVYPVVAVALLFLMFYWWQNEKPFAPA